MSPKSNLTLQQKTKHKNTLVQRDHSALSTRGGTLLTLVQMREEPRRGGGRNVFIHKITTLTLFYEAKKLDVDIDEVETLRKSLPDAAKFEGIFTFAFVHKKPSFGFRCLQTTVLTESKISDHSARPRDQTKK